MESRAVKFAKREILENISALERSMMNPKANKFKEHILFNLMS